MRQSLVIILSAITASPIAVALLPRFYGLAAADEAIAHRSTADLIPTQGLEDPLQPLDPVQHRTEIEQDRLHAAALYAAGRLYEKQPNLDKALRYYQRAVRYAPDNFDALSRIVLLERAMQRHTELARYAVLLAKAGRADSLNLLRAFVYLRQESRDTEALEIYEKSVGDRAEKKTEPAWIELHKMAGRVYLDREDYGPAARAYAIVDAVLRHPDKYGLNQNQLKLLQGDNPAKICVLAGEAFLKTDQLDKARVVLQRAHMLDPKLQLKHYAEAQVHLAAGRIKAAEQALQQYFDSKATEQGDGPYRLLETLLSEDQKQPQLIERLESLQALAPEDPELAFFLAEKYIAADNTEAAQTLLERTLRENPRGAGYRNLVKIYRSTANAAALLDTIGDLARRQGTLGILGDEWTAITGDEAIVSRVVAVARERLKSEKPPLPFGQRLSVALLAAAAEQPALAAQFFELAVESDQEERSLVYELWGMQRLQAEDYAKAASIYQRAIDEKVIEASNPIFHYYLAGALAVSDRYDEALEQARYAATTVDDSAEFANRVAWVLNVADRREQAIEAYTQLIDRFDSDRDSYEVRDIVREARLTLSHLNVKNERFAEGEELLEQVLDEFPDDVGAWNDLGYLWAERGVHLIRAHAMIQRAVKAEPDNTAYRDSLGWVLHRMGKNQQALEQLKLAVDEAEPDGVVLDHLGDVHSALGQSDQALKAWDQAIKALKKKKDVDLIDPIRTKIDQHKQDNRGP